MRFGAWAAGCAALLALAGCRSNTAAPAAGGPKADAGQEYYLIAISTGVPYWADSRKGFEDRARQLGVQGVFTGPQDFDPAAQASQLDQIITKRPAGIILVPADAAALQPGIDRAVAQGIPVLCMDTDSPQSKRLGYVGTQNYEAGRVVGRLLAERMGGKGAVGVSRLIGQLNIEERYRGVRDEIARHPGMRIVAEANDKADPVEAARANSAMLAAHPELEGVVGLDGCSGSGIARSVIEAGKKGKIRIVCFDRDEDMLGYIEDGTIDASVAQKSYLMAWTALTYLHALANGSIPHLADWRAAQAPPVPSNVDTGTMVIDQRNAAQFRHAPAG
ncbi:MAG: substrate-binding domain-containing protein [Chthonomonadales bacterium]|nr:substrate-binding domain-containing protein [Chthonomonadales bacterium]